MCEWCGKVDKSELKELGPEEAEELLCEAESVKAPRHMCGAPARYRSGSRFVEMHVCGRHARDKTPAMGGGPGDPLEAAALVPGFILKPIPGGECCEDYDFRGAGERGAPARYACMVTQDSYSCGHHKDDQAGRA